jgi:hypothetical protein
MMVHAPSGRPFSSPHPILIVVLIYSIDFQQLSLYRGMFFMAIQTYD